MESNLKKFNVIDKSIAQRAAIIGGLFFGERVKIDFLDGSLGEDVLSAIRCAEELKTGKRKLYAGNSATALRLVAGAAVGLGLEIEIYGDESLNNRCMKKLVMLLRQMGARVFGIERGRKVLPPIRVEKSVGLRAISFDNKNLSAQIKSAVLLAGFNLDEKSAIKERIKTRDHTELMLEYLGGFGNDEDVILKIPYDISSAAFLIALGLLKGNCIEFDGIGINPTRVGFVEILQKSGVDIRLEQTDFYGLERVGKIIVKHAASTMLEPICVDKNNLVGVIDEIPILCVVASFINGESIFKDLGVLRNKESDRVAEIYKMLKSFGVRVELSGDELRIEGGEFNAMISKPVIISKDHRIIMAASVMAELLNGCEILHKECVKVSYPNFFKDIKYI